VGLQSSLVIEEWFFFFKFFFVGVLVSIPSKKFISKDLGSVGKGRLVVNIHQEKFGGGVFIAHASNQQMVIIV